MKNSSVSKNRHKTLREWAYALSRSGGNKIALIFILLLAAFFRFYGLNWDQGHHLHPDERMIIMVTESLHLPKPLNLRTILDPNSPLNPKFFAYGNFPLYFLKLISFITSQAFGQEWTHYNHINLLGRGFSVIFDLGTILLIFKMGRRIFSRKTALLASFLYAICVLPIQLSHFYAVDVILNFFILLTLYCLVLFYEQQTFKQATLLGIAFGLALATKVSATVLLASIGTTLVFDILLIFFKRWRMATLPWWKKIFFFVFKSKKKTLIIRIVRVLVGYGFVISASALLTFLICQPYALIDFSTFWQQINEQHRMTKDAYVFPYTLQYVGTTPYLYHLKNLWLWGMGIGLGSLSLVGTIFYLITKALKTPARWADALLGGGEEKTAIEAKKIILIVFFLAYFLTVGRFAVKFMRYLLPLYSIFCLFAAWFLSEITPVKGRGPHGTFRPARCPDERRGLLGRASPEAMPAARVWDERKQRKFLPRVGKITLTITLGLTFLWTLAFMAIYTKPNTRVLATQWFDQNVPLNSKIAVEHWDDRVPMWGNYQFLEMPMYEPDSSKTKWQQVEKNLKEADYLVLASNRLYVPLQRLADCQKYKVCYPKTAQYYQKLFNEKLDFKKVAEFTSYPKFSIFSASWRIQFSIPDDSADESFTVYDHPKIIIFRRSF